MKTKQRNLFVALILSVAIIFGTFGALSLTNVNKASALSSVTADATLTDFEAVNSKAKIIENEVPTHVKNGAYVIPYQKFKWADVDKMEYSIDILKCSQFRMYLAYQSHFLDYSCPSYTAQVKNGILSFINANSSSVGVEGLGEYYLADSVVVDGHTVKMPEHNAANTLSISVQYGFNIKTTYYGADYVAVDKDDTSSVLYADGEIVNYTITPFDENGDLNDSAKKDIFFISRKNYNTTTEYIAGLTMMGENKESVVDNVKLTKHAFKVDEETQEKIKTETIETVVFSHEFNNSTGIYPGAAVDKVCAFVRNSKGKYELTNGKDGGFEIFNNADGIVSKTAINDKQYIIDGEMSLTQLDNGKKMGLLLGMANKTDNVGADGTSYAHFTNEDGITYFGVDENKVSLGSNLVGGKVNYKLQVNNDGSVIADVNSSKLFFTIPKENVNGYIAYKSSGAGTVNASVDATTINTYNVVGEMSEGASIRLGTLDNSGMRFETTFTKETVDALANAGYKSIEYGTLITRADLLNGSSVTIEELSAKSIWHKTIVSTISDPDAEDNVYCGSLISINAQNFGKEFIGRGYVKVVDANDNVIYFYADFFGGSVANNTRSVKWIAEQYQASEEYNDYSSSLKTGDVNVVEAYINGVSNVG